MAHSIGKTIAELRKTKGWTQVQVAEKLGVSDKAVSKWESEGGFPEITQLPALASFFDTTIDYLLTGKNIEAISLDDMDSEKRRFYLIERDDAEKYIKYDYVSTCFNMSKNEFLNEKIAIKEIIKNKSYKIFNACVDAGMRVSRDNWSSGLSKAYIFFLRKAGISSA